MLGRFTWLFDYAHRVPVLGSSREPVRFHVWVSLGVARLRPSESSGFRAVASLVAVGSFWPVCWLLCRFRS